MNSRLERTASTRAASPASAERMFSSEPFDAARPRDVAAEIGKTTDALFQVFATKEDLRRDAVGGEPPDLEPGQKVALRLRVHPRVTFNLRRRSRGFVFEATAPGRAEVKAAGETTGAAIKAVRAALGNEGDLKLSHDTRQRDSGARLRFACERRAFGQVGA